MGTEFVFNFLAVGATCEDRGAWPEIGARFGDFLAFGLALRALHARIV